MLMGLPTVPLRNEHHISDCIALFEDQNKAIFSATSYGFPITFAFHKDEHQGWKPTFSDSPMLTGNTRSQDHLPAYHPNGAIYVRKVSDFDQRWVKHLV